MELLTHRMVGQHVVVEFVAACSQHYAAASLNSLFLAVDFNPNAENFVVLSDQLQAACVVNNANLTDGFNSVAVVVEEHVAAASFLSFRSAETPFIDSVGFRNVLETGVTINPKFCSFFEAGHPVFDSHDFFAEGIQQFVIFFGVRKIISCRQIL